MPFKKGQVPKKTLRERPEDINRSGRPKGTRNRSTIVSKWLETRTRINDPNTDKEIQVEFEDAIVLAQIKNAIEGDLAAYKELMDTKYGRITDKQDVTTNGKEISFARFLMESDD